MFSWRTRILPSRIRIFPIRAAVIPEEIPTIPVLRVGWDRLMSFFYYLTISISSGHKNQERAWRFAGVVSSITLLVHVQQEEQAHMHGV